MSINLDYHFDNTVSVFKKQLSAEVIVVAAVHNMEM